MLRAILTSYQVFMEPECQDAKEFFAQLVLLCRLEQCQLCDQKPCVMQNEPKENAFPVTDVTGVFSKTKRVDEMLFGVLDCGFKIGVGIKLPCGSATVPDFEGKNLRLEGEFQLHVRKEVEEIDSKPLKLTNVKRLFETNSGDVVVSFEAIEKNS